MYLQPPYKYWPLDPLVGIRKGSESVSCRDVPLMMNATITILKRAAPQWCRSILLTRTCQDAQLTTNGQKRSQTLPTRETAVGAARGLYSLNQRDASTENIIAKMETPKTTPHRHGKHKWISLLRWVVEARLASKTTESKRPRRRSERRINIVTTRETSSSKAPYFCCNIVKLWLTLSGWLRAW